MELVRRRMDHAPGRSGSSVMSEGHAMGNTDDSTDTANGAVSAMPRFAQNTVGRDFAVGDIHGCFTELQRGLDTIGFDPCTDRLFSVGDLVDRGRESHLALQWLDKPWFHAICGNHDFMAWRHAIGQPCDDVDHLQHGGAWLLMLSDAQRHEFGARLAALPLATEVETGPGHRRPSARGLPVRRLVGDEATAVAQHRGPRRGC